MGSRIDTLLWIASGLYAILIIIAVYALSIGDESLFRTIAFLSIGSTGAAVWTVFLARRQGWE